MASETPAASTNVIQVASKDHFNDLVQFVEDDVLVVIDFTATWCGPCKRIKPQYAKLSVIHSKALFLEADVDALPELAETFKVKCMPTFVLLKNKKLLHQQKGTDMGALSTAVAHFTQ